MNEKDIKSVLDALCKPDDGLIELFVDSMMNKTLSEVLDEKSSELLNYRFVLSDAIVANFELDRKSSYLISGIIDKSLDRFFDRYFRYNEGMGCSADKKRFTIKKILKSLELKENQSLEYFYKEGDFPTKEKDEKYRGELAYWCPTSIKTTDEAIELYKNYLLVSRSEIMFNKDFLEEIIKKTT